jgi:hypothetical protein
MTYSGFFEAHITIELFTIELSTIEVLPHKLLNQAKKRQKIVDFKDFCENFNIKPIYIELERGDTPTQVMTSSLHEGDFEKIKKEVENIAQKLQNNHFQISRMKIEAHPDNIGVPLQNKAILAHQINNYFECHFKILLDKNFETLKNICENNKAHLSKEAFESFEELENILIKNNFKIEKKIVEYCVFDDNEFVDNNWLAISENTISENTISENSPCEVCEKINNCYFSIKNF